MGGDDISISIIKVPGAFKGELSQACRDPEAFDLRIQSDDCDSWVPPTKEQVLNLGAFCAGHFAGAPSKSWRACSGVRYGYNREGVYVNENHVKRFFGLGRASASVSLKRAVPEALPEFTTGDRTRNGLSSTDRMLSNLMTHLPSISDDMRFQVLRTTFTKADVNKNGVLSRVEVGTMFRKVVNTMSASDIEEVMDQADSNNDKALSYKEFVDWLQESAPDKVKHRMQSSLRTEADVVKASFRLWDRNGDGLITLRELEKVLNRMCKTFAPSQVKTLCQLIDADRDGNVDYDEFVDFLFFTHKRN